MTRTVIDTLGLAALLFFSLDFSTGAQPASPNIISSQEAEIMARLHPGIEPMDGRVEEDRAYLVGQGPLIFSGVISLFQNNTDPMTVGTLAGVVTRMEGDRTSLLPAIRAMALRDQPWAREICAALLGEVGTPDDCELLMSLVQDSSARVCMASVKSIAKIGRASDIERLIAMMKNRATSLPEEERSADSLLRQMEGAVQLLRNRHGLAGTDKLAEKRAVVLSSARIEDATRELSRSWQIGICCEYTSGDNADMTTNRISLEMKGVSLESALDHIVAMIPDYRWEFDEASGLVNIYPKDSSLLDAVHHNISVTNRTVPEIFDIDDLLNLKGRDISFFPGRGNMEWLKVPISIQVDNVTTRQALNRLCGQLPFKARWEVFRLPQANDATLMIFPFGD